MTTNKTAFSAIVVEVSDELPTTGKNYTDPATGVSRVGKTRQICYLHCGQRYPIVFKKSVPVGEQPYRPGFYLIAGAPFKVSEYEGLNFRDSAMELVPIAEAIDQFKPLLTQNGPKLAAAG